MSEEKNELENSQFWRNDAIDRLLGPSAFGPKDVEGVILCAGLGTRMAPLTHTIPKPLLPALNCPLLFWNLSELRRHTCRIHINTYYLHHAFKPVQLLAREFGIDICNTLEEAPSGPFGGVLACLRNKRLPNDVIVVAGDGLYKVDLKAVLDFHRSRTADLTIGVAAVKDGSRYGVISADQNQRVFAMREKPKNIGAVSAASCGVYILNRRVIEEFLGATGIVDWVDVVSVLLSEKRRVMAAPVSQWLDAGIPSDLVDLNLELLNSEAVGRVAEKRATAAATLWTQGQVHNAEAVSIGGRVLLGAEVAFERESFVENSVIGTSVSIGSGTEIRNSLIMPGANVPASTAIVNKVWC
jgi:NDP-sugar pyrophosphorylase family protein